MRIGAEVRKPDSVLDGHLSNARTLSLGKASYKRPKFTVAAGRIARFTLSSSLEPESIVSVALTVTCVLSVLAEIPCLLLSGLSSPVKHQSDHPTSAPKMRTQIIAFSGCN